MITEISAALTSLNAAQDLISGLLSARDKSLIQSKAAELNASLIAAQGSAIEAQASYSLLLDKVGELEAELLKMKNWTKQKQDYELVSVREGVHVYQVKDRLEEHIHQGVHLCPHCFENSQQISILQKRHVAIGRKEFLDCHNCGLQLCIKGLT